MGLNKKIVAIVVAVAAFIAITAIGYKSLEGIKIWILEIHLK